MPCHSAIANESVSLRPRNVPNQTSGPKSPESPTLSGPAFGDSLRSITGRRSLPGSRAIVGGALIAIAALGTFVVASGLGHHDGRLVVVATHDLTPGMRLTAGDVHVVRTTIDDSLATHMASSVAAVTGQTIVGFIAQGEALQAGSVMNKRSEQPEISFALASARAVAGTLRSGERVDVLATARGTSNTDAVSAAENATVLSVDKGATSLGQNADLTITLAVNSRDEAARVAAAVARDDITLVRTTGLTSVR